MSTLDYAVPIRELIDESAIPLDFVTSAEGPVGDVLDKLFFTDYAVSSGPEHFGASLDLLIAGETALAIPGLDGFAFVFGSDGANATLVRLSFLATPAGLTAQADDVSIALRFPPSILKPMPEMPGDEAPRFAQIEMQGTLSVDEHFNVWVEGFSGLSLRPAMIGDSGIVISAENVQLDLSRTDTTPEIAAAGFEESFMGVFMGEARVHLPEGLPDIAPEDLVLRHAAIGTGGVSGELAVQYTPTYDAATKQFSGRGSGTLFGIPFGLESVDIRVQQNSFQRAAFTGKLLLPFFDAPVDVEVGLGLDGSLTVGLTAPGGLTTLSTPVLDIEVDGIGFEVDAGTFLAKISGKLTPTIAGLAWPTFDVRELSIDCEGNVRLEGGWLDLPRQYALDFHAFKVEITRIGFGNTDDGGRWVGFSGGLNLVEGLSAGASVEGLRVTWYNDDRAPGITLEGVSVEFEVPGAVRFQGAVSYRQLTVGGEQVHRFDGDITLDLIAIGLEIDGKLVIGSASGPSGPYTFFAIYVSADLPAGIPLWTTGLGLYGIAGLFALNMEPNKPPEQPWYGESPSEGWYHVPTVGVTDLRNKWVNHLGSLAFGAGVTIGTVADNGFTFAGKVLLVIVFPGPIIMIEGKANLLKKRTSLDDEPLFRTLAVIDRRAGTVTVGLDAQYTFGAAGELIDIHGGAEAFYDSNDPTAWHVYLGERDPRERRIRAGIFQLFEANAYFMLDAEQLAVGCWVGYDRSWDFGRLHVALEAWIEANAIVNWNPAHFHGELATRGKAELRVFGFGLTLVIDAPIAADVFNPFHLVGHFHAGIGLPWPLPDFDVEVTLEWGPEPEPPVLPAVLQDVAVEHFKVTTKWPLTATTSAVGTPPTDAPTVPLDARPHITFARPVHDDALVGVNPQPQNPEWERLGDPASNQGPARARYAVREVALHAWRGDSWQLVAHKGTTATPADVATLFGSWAAIPAMSPDGAGRDVAQVKLWLWSKMPFDYTGHTSSSWDEWFTDHYPDYPCIPPAPDRVVCCDFEQLPVGTGVRPPRTCQESGIAIGWTSGDEREVLWLDPLVGTRRHAVCLDMGAAGDRQAHPIDLKAVAARPMFVVTLAEPADWVEVTVVDRDGVLVYATGAGGPLPPVEGGRPGSPKVVVTGDGIRQVVVVPRSSACLVSVCARIPASREEIARREEMLQHLRDELARWSQTSDVLAANTDYRLSVTTQTEAVGEAELADWAVTDDVTSYAYFRTAGPPGISTLSVPAGQSAGAEFASGLDDLTVYVDQTVPPTVVRPGERPALPRPVYRAYDTGVRFNEDYVDLLYRIAGRDLALLLFDINDRPVRDAEGRLVVPPNRWGRTEQHTLTTSEQLWVRTVDGSTCASLDPSTIPGDSVLLGTANGLLLNPDTVYQARLVPLLLHDDLTGPALGASAAGTGATLGRWVVRDLGTNGTPSQWRIGEAGTPATRHVRQAAAVWGGSTDGRDAHKPGTLLLRAAAPALPAGHREQPANWTDYRASVYLRLEHDEAAGVVFRYVDDTHHYRFSMDRRRRYRRLTRTVGATTTVLAEDRFTAPTNSDLLVTVEAIGPALRVLLDGHTVFAVQDASLPHGGFGLYTWGDAAARFADVRVEDLSPGAPAAYRYSFTTSAFATFAHQLHSFDDVTGPVLDIPGTAPALAGLTWANLPLAGPPSDTEAKDHARLADAVLGAAAQQRPDRFDIVPVRAGGSVVGLLVRSPEPIDWRRASLAVRYATDPERPPSPPGVVKLVGATTSTTGDPTEESVRLIPRDTTDLSSGRIEALRLPGPLDDPVGDQALLRESFDHMGGVLFEETFGPNALDHYEIVDAGTSLGPSRWSVTADTITQTANVYGGAVYGSDPHRPGTLALVGDPAWGNVVIRAVLRSDDDDAIGVAFRYLDGDNFYRFSMDHERSVRQLVRRHTGTTTVLWEDSVAYAIGRSYLLEVFAYGDRLVGHLDHVPLFDMTDTAIPRGRVGLYSWLNIGARFEALRVEELTSDPVLWAPELTDLGPLEIVTAPSGNQGPARWSAADGELRQTSNYHVSGAGAARLATMAVGGDPAWRDIRLSARLRSEDDDAIGVVFRYVDAENYYRFSMDSQRGYRRLVRRAVGVTTVLWQDTVAYTVGREYVVTVEASGPVLRGWLDGVPLFSVRDARHESGRVGMYCWANPGARFWSVTVIDASRRLGQWTVHDDTPVGGPSRWVATGGALDQRAAVGEGSAPAFAGTWIEAGDRGWTEVRLVARLRADGQRGAGVVFRVVDAANHYRLSFDAQLNRRWLVKVAGGVTTVLWQAVGGHRPGEAFEVSVDAVGDQLVGWLDGTPLFNVTDPTHRRGAVGVWSWGDSALRAERVEVSRPPLEARALFRDRFATGDMSPWTVVDQGGESAPSSWAVSGRELAQTSNIHSLPTDPADPAKPGTLTVAGDPTWTDVVLLLRLRSLDDDAIGVVFRYGDGDNHYRFSMDSQRGYRRLVKFVSGTVTVLWEDATRYEVGRSYELAVLTRGDELRGWLDGVPVFAVRDADLSAGRIGLYCWADQDARFSDVLVLPAATTFDRWDLRDRFALLRSDRWAAVDDGDTGGPSAWNVNSGGGLVETAGVSGPGATATGAGRTGSALLTGREWGDIRVITTLTHGAGGGTGAAGLAVRWQGPGDHHAVLVDEPSGQLSFVRVRASVATALWSGGTAPAAGHPATLTVDMVGDHFTGWLDGVRLFDLRDAGPATGRVGPRVVGGSDAVFAEVLMGAAYWSPWYVFGDEPALPAGTIVVVEGGAGMGAAPEPGVERRSVSPSGPPARAGLSHRPRLRFAGTPAQSGHARTFRPDADFADVPMRASRSADGTALFVVGAQPAVPSALVGGDYRLVLTYQRDNTAANPGSIVLTQGGSDADEVVVLDVPWWG
jgi:hypothetical protein